MFEYDSSNLEIFSQQINELEKKDLIDLKKIMSTYKDLYNVIKSFNYTDLLEKVKIDRISKMIREVDRRIDIVNLTAKENSDNSSLLNVALADIEFNFKKISEEELVIADKYQKELDSVRKEFLSNIDKDDYKFIKLYNEFKSLFTNINMEDLTTKDIENNTNQLKNIKKEIHLLNESNNRLLIKYLGDEKYVKIHKRVLEKLPSMDKIILHEMLLNLKEEIDNMLLRKYDVMDNEEFFKKSIMPNVADEFDDHNLTIEIDEITFFTNLIVDMYLFERKLNSNG